jgi:hypothetical protein
VYEQWKDLKSPLSAIDEVLLFDQRAMFAGGHVESAVMKLEKPELWIDLIRY